VSASKAKRDADVLDLASKVQYIGVNGVQGGTADLAAIKDSMQVARLVSMVLAAPFDQNGVGQVLSCLSPQRWHGSHASILAGLG